jgi:hypothetical protein
VRWLPPRRLNLALQGGGAHGAYTWDVLDVLQRFWGALGEQRPWALLAQRKTDVFGLDPAGGPVMKRCDWLQATAAWAVAAVSAKTLQAQAVRPAAAQPAWRIHHHPLARGAASDAGAGGQRRRVPLSIPRP